LLPRGVGPGDTVLGLASSGLHSNGFSLVRQVVAAGGLSWDAPAPFTPNEPFAPNESPRPTLGQALMTPTRIYVRSLLALHRAGLLKAAAHITGGGLPGNLPRVLPEGCVAALEPTWPVPPVFGWLARTGGVAPDEMLRVFNCGIGMALVVGDRDADAATRLLEAEGEQVTRIGTIEAGTGEAVVRIALPVGWPA
jgi:phosphoribosylformylglycinamidine cyclo-ligase